MSAQNIEFTESGAVKRDHSNVDRRDEIIDALENDDDVDEDTLPGERASQQELTEARRTLAAEEQPGEDGEVPDLRETFTEEFRGHEFEWYEMGDRIVKAASFNDSDIEDGEQSGSAAIDYIYETVGAMSVEADESYWRQYDFGGGEDTDGILDLFEKFAERAGGAGLDPEEVERSQQFRNE